uniref:Uncharacterized protein n=1 Tax=Knipowitschia caucasica TaxID=637954 RepID=A0AAV2L8S5_KNICA
MDHCLYKLPSLTAAPGMSRRSRLDTGHVISTLERHGPGENTAIPGGQMERSPRLSDTGEGRTGTGTGADKDPATNPLKEAKRSESQR